MPTLLETVPEKYMQESINRGNLHIAMAMAAVPDKTLGWSAHEALAEITEWPAMVA